jgi:uncharacterized glyoxalase superfamily protein PhnB
MATDKPVLDQINIVVGDFGRSLAFYRRLGVSFPDSESKAEQFHANAHSDEGAAIDLDSSPFAQVWNEGWKGRSDLVGRVVVGFKLASREAVDQTYAGLTGDGHRGLQPPVDAFWGARYAIVEDPNGLAVGLMSPSDAAKRYWPPKGWPR